MADIKPAEISAIIKKQLTGSDVSPSLDEVGTVLQVGDGISRVYGLSNVQYGELVQFENGMEGIVCLLYTSPSPRDLDLSRMPSSA